MNAVWAGAHVLTICCILLVRHTITQAENNGTVIRKYETDNATLIWSVNYTPEYGKLDFLYDSVTIISFVLKNPSTRDPRIIPAGDRNATFGFTLHNVSLTDAGEYGCKFEAVPCGQTILFIWGRPERGRVRQEGDRLWCDVQLTSQPAKYRLPGANTEYEWHKRDLLPPDGTLNDTLPGETRLRTGESYITPGHAENGSYYSCFGKEEGSRLWSDSGEWYQYMFYAAGSAVPDERNGGSTSPNVTDIGKDKVFDIEFVIIVSLVSLVAVLLIAVTITVVILCRRKKSIEVNQNGTNKHQMAAKGHEQYSDEEDSTVLVDNTEYSDNNYFGSDSGLGEYSDIREIERLRIKNRGPAPLPQKENIYELQVAVQVSGEHNAKLENKDDEDEERIVTDMYAVPMKKGTLK